ncbi:MAG: hypothetical protein IKY27_10470, partial [Bacteroidales bacterium]|nr:hypothetical protein [Bacteroidales bacterium]
EGTCEELIAFEDKMLYHKENLLKDYDVRWYPNANTSWQITIADTIVLEAMGGAVDVDDLCVANNVKIRDTVSAWAVTNIYSEENMTIKAWVGFEAAARSNRISGGIGPQGRWENKGKLLVNGEEYLPNQQWNEPEQYKFHYHTWHRPEEELPYTDEQFYWMREPVEISLKKGDNDIRLYIPKTFKGQRWSFGFVLTKD